jgi:hypothetical protein
LAEIDVDDTWTVGSDCREEVLRLETMRDLLELFAIPGEEDRASSRSIPYAYHISLDVLRTIIGGIEWLIVSSLARGEVRNRRLVKARHTK